MLYSKHYSTHCIFCFAPFGVEEEGEEDVKVKGGEEDGEKNGGKEKKTKIPCSGCNEVNQWKLHNYPNCMP